MAYINEEKKEVNGLTTHIIQTEKFKTTTLVLKMLAPLKKEDVTNRALLPYVLQRGTKSFSTTTELRKHLDELYGATLQVDLTKKGENHVISFRMEVPNEKFLSDQTPLLEHALKLLSEIILSPVEENGTFKKEFVEQEKRSLKQRIQAVYDDKMRYSNLRLVQEMCKGEAYALHVNGEKEEADKITPESLYKYYERCRAEDKVDLYIVGDLAESDVKNLVMKYFTFEGNSHKRAPETKTNKKIDKVKEEIEEQDVKQGKLNIGYRTNCTYQDEDYHALQVFNGIYGGFSHSKLFINVREKASLAYYAASRVESHKGLLMVMSGIEFANYDQAVTIIKEQMTAMKNGEFTEKEIEQTKAVIRNQLLETIDTSYGMVEVLYHNVIADIDRTFDEWIEKINDVTKEDIIKAAEKIELDTIYFLKGMGGNQ
ncbi:EF-P 5-aminopentanol modification-associated protein YfmF [Metabacillus arenae]|uniref:Insulinase family protein n=1 Tax=Metabacillus arenae TaxID=2771434 RepID=A0A926NK16_9BACI|nr:pitrilysin family protein [Metabacillus arenae]MBD1379281.1 insulinase family protein [Metabacillus arenae]